MGVTAAVAGASGYAGGELLRLLLGHPHIDLGALTAESNTGRSVTEVHPHLPALAERNFDPTDPSVLAEADLVFLALPHGESAGVAAAIPPSVPVIDLGADHRLGDAVEWERFYGTPYAGRWAYGLPELPDARESIRSASRVAAPGCYPTAVALGLAPLLAAGLVEPTDIVVVAASGTSGAGRGMKAQLMSAEVMGALSAYKAGGAHQHSPEMEQALSEAAGETVILSFTPVLAPMPRGILATCTARSTESPEVIREALVAAYVDEPFVTVLPEGTWPHTGAVLGSNSCHLQVAVDAHAGRVVVVSAIDNLTKGAAGQALQCANLLLGLPETEGLAINGVAP